MTTATSYWIPSYDLTESVFDRLRVQLEELPRLNSPPNPSPSFRPPIASGGRPRDVRIGGGPSTIRQFLAADLIDHMHIVPVLLARGERLWDGLEELERGFEFEAISSPSGVTHLTFTRR